MTFERLGGFRAGGCAERAERGAQRPQRDSKLGGWANRRRKPSTKRGKPGACVGGHTAETDGSRCLRTVVRGQCSQRGLWRSVVMNAQTSTIRHISSTARERRSHVVGEVHAAAVAVLLDDQMRSVVEAPLVPLPALRQAHVDQLDAPRDALLLGE